MMDFRISAFLLLYNNRRTLILDRKVKATRSSSVSSTHAVILTKQEDCAANQKKKWVKKSQSLETLTKSVISDDEHVASLRFISPARRRQQKKKRNCDHGKNLPQAVFFLLGKLQSALFITSMRLSTQSSEKHCSSTERVPSKECLDEKF